MIKGVKKITWRTSQIAQTTDNTAFYRPQIWQIYGLPAVIYGAEILKISQKLTSGY